MNPIPESEISRQSRLLAHTQRLDLVVDLVALGVAFGEGLDLAGPGFVALGRALSAFMTAA